MVDRKTSKAVANKYGYTAQAGQLTEECAELIVALNKFNRAGGMDGLNNKSDSESAKRRRKQIIEEIADVAIMLDQIIYLLDADYEVQNEIKFKQWRESERIKRRGEKKCND
ncbi:MAG: hypothetical protein J1F01_05565 [Oscillospiraceae bacterium]|nr:hypothetical protein [Oscillospiraceae bacterium]